MKCHHYRAIERPDVVWSWSGASSGAHEGRRAALLLEMSQTQPTVCFHTVKSQALEFDEEWEVLLEARWIPWSSRQA